MIRIQCSRLNATLASLDKGHVPQARHVDDELLAVVIVIVPTICGPFVLARARVEGAQLEKILPVDLEGLLGATLPKRTSLPSTTLCIGRNGSM